jgi:hypothetical protein
MTGRTFLLAALLAGAASPTMSQPAQAYCGVLEKSALAGTVKKATRLANNAINREDRKLRRQNGMKYVPSERSVACVGGAVAIDANGNQIAGKPSCTVTMPFCVNP